MYVCMYVCMYVYTYIQIHMHIHARTHTPSLVEYTNKNNMNFIINFNNCTGKTCFFK